MLREPLKGMRPVEFTSYLRQNQSNPRESKLVGELSGAALSCGAAVIGWFVVLFSGASIPLTGGTSSAVTYLSTTAALASSAQCGIGLYRSYNEAFDNGKRNDELDSKEWFQTVINALDIVSLAGAGASAAITVKAVKVMKVNTRKSYGQILKGLSRHERKRITEELIRLNQPGISRRMLKQYVRSGKYPKRYSASSLQKAYANQLTEAVGASLSFSGSALSGVINGVAVGVWEKVSDARF